ncbi:hypothetical protein WJF72_001001 [Klebsiella aerogenes]
MNIDTVNEIIQSLESAGELSIKERKYLDLAKAYADKEAESVAQALMFEKCRELSGCPAGVDLQDWVKKLAAESLQWQMSIPPRIVAGIKADGATAAGDYLKLEAQHMPVVERLMMQDAAEICYGTAARLREGADK